MRTKVPYVVVVLALLFGAAGTSVGAAPSAAPAVPVAFTILHTNDFHGQLEASGSNPGMARVAQVVNDVRTAVGENNVLLVDAGDEMQGSLLSNLQKGAPTIAVFNAMGYNAATFGNHEFDWGQPVLTARVGEATYPFVTANIVVNDTGDCSTAGWTTPSFAQPYVIKEVGTAPDTVKVAFIGVTTAETPIITIASATAGLCFKDPADSILHYYDAAKAEADVIVVLSHLGFTDGGYGYGIPVYGDQTLAQKLITAGKPVPLIIGGHTHTNVTLPPPVIGGKTTVVQAYYNGRQVGRADLTFDPGTGDVTVAWQKLAVSTTGVKDPTVDGIIQTYSSDPDYQALINQPIGYAQVDLLRNYNGDAMMGDFVDDAIYNALNADTEPANDVDMFFNNPGGIRTDWCDAPDLANPGQYIWSNNAADCNPGLWTHDPMLLNYGQMFTILPFGNATVVGEMTGAQILELLDQAATLGKGAIQPAGMAYKFYSYSDGLPGPQPFAWGAFDACVVNRSSGKCDSLDMKKIYRVGTNEFLAPAGGDNFSAFKYMTNITYWGDMLNAVNAWVSANYTMASPYKGPNNDGMLDGRITRDGNNNGGSIIPVTILHHNDSHGNLVKGRYVGYTQLASLITQERAHNPTRTVLLNAGDQIQGDAMMAFYKTAPLGYSSDGTTLPPELRTHPMIAAMNAMTYTAWTLGNHEFNFGNEIFKAVLEQSTAPVLQANLEDDGRYGIAEVPVSPYTTLVLPDGAHGDIRLAILGIGNHRVPNYELPSNIVGLTFTDPIATAQEWAPRLQSVNDAVIALTHIGFTTDPGSVEVDNNVDTYLAAQTNDIDAIIGAHSHTDPSNPPAPYKYLPTFVASPNDTPVIINQAYRYNNTLGEVILGLRPKAYGGYEVVARSGRYISVDMDTPEDPRIKAIVDPYVTNLNAYIDTTIGQTTVPLDALTAYTEETNGANLQADASVWELTKNGINVDFHLSGAMSNRKVADSATPEAPVTLKVNDMFTLMPYENSLLVMRMNGPQLKAILERAYRNYYYYKYVPNHGGYSYYTTCMIDINKGGQITYVDRYPQLPDGNNVVALMINGKPVDFKDAETYYEVSTVNYLAAGSCNFNNNGVTLWPLDQITHDTQYYVRDVVIDYIKAQTGPISPAVEGRLKFDINDWMKVYLPVGLSKGAFGEDNEN
jgi:5'-nucleotidase/UDP-sugar diphosphatase